MADKKVAGVVLAAGEGKRLKSDLPKVLHDAAGKPLIVHVFDALAEIELTSRVVVVSARGAEVKEALQNGGHDDLEYAVQDPPRGTGDALRVALPQAGTVDAVLVTNGDSPLLLTETVTALIEAHLGSDAGATMLTAVSPGPTDGGRIIRGAAGTVQKIVESRDATPEELEILEINTGIFVFDAHGLGEMLDSLSPDNSQNEYYLTDLISMLQDQGRTIQAFSCPWEETLGVNDRSNLAEVSGILRRRTAEKWMREGATIIDPASTFIDSTVTIERDAVIMPFTFLEGKTTIGEGAEVGPQTRLINVSVAPGATVTFSVARDSEVGPGCERRSVRVAPAGDRPLGRVQDRDVRRDEEHDPRRGEQGEPPRLPGGCGDREGRERGGRHDHVQLGRPGEAQDDDRRRGLHLVGHDARGAGSHREASGNRGRFGSSRRRTRRLPCGRRSGPHNQGSRRSDGQEQRDRAERLVVCP